MRRRAQRQILPIGKERRVGAQVLRDLFGLALLNRGSCCQHVVIVLERQLDGFVEGDTGRSGALAECRN